MRFTRETEIRSVMHSRSSPDNRLSTGTVEGISLSLPVFEEELTRRLSVRHLGHSAEIAWACGWLESAGYPGLKLLIEALGDSTKSLALERDALGIDLQNVSCVYLGPSLVDEIKRNGRAFLRNVRHGLYLLPYSVKEHLAIGCPIDPGFALGGPRSKNPYEEKLEAAEKSGLMIDQNDWQQLQTSLLHRN
jgi:hypothetical protein